MTQLSNIKRSLSAGAVPLLKLPSNDICWVANKDFFNFNLAMMLNLLISTSAFRVTQFPNVTSLSIHHNTLMCLVGFFIPDPEGRDMLGGRIRIFQCQYRHWSHGHIPISENQFQFRHVTGHMPHLICHPG